MKLGRGKYENFSSYASLEFTFDDLGLTLVSGPTGSGKSTVMDAPAWCLFGITSKEGAVDEVKSWGADAPTKGEQEVYLNDGARIVVTRCRGSAKQNDLFWTEPASPDTPVRGKDVKETQDLLEDRLGVTAELYLLGSYFSQFSRGDVFFTSRPKDRRDTLERIADLSLPVKIMEGASAQRKAAKSDVEASVGRLSRVEGQLESLSRAIGAAQQDSAAWEASRAADLLRLRASARGFDADKSRRQSEYAELLERLDAEISASDAGGGVALRELDTKILALQKTRETLREEEKALAKLQADAQALDRSVKRLDSLGEVCPTCLGKTKGVEAVKERKRMESARDALSHRATVHQESIEALEAKLGEAPVLEKERSQLLKLESQAQVRLAEFRQAQKDYERVEAEENTYLAQIAQLEKQLNPHMKRSKDAAEEHSLAGICAAKLKQEIEEQEHRVAQLNLIYDLSFALRGQLLQNAVQEIQAETNRIIEKYFEGEIQVDFSLDADKLEVSIQKSGYECSFRQLSGGQRRILTLSFAVALMGAAANKAGVHFDNIFLDEPLNGLDDGLKAKAFGLFEELSTRHSTVMVVEHTEEMKGLFSKVYAVKLIADVSEIEEQA